MVKKDTLAWMLVLLFFSLVISAIMVLNTTSLSTIDTDGTTYLSYDCGDTLTSYFSFSKQSCVEYGVQGIQCTINEIETSYTKSECSQKGGIWDECPQCPQGLICAKSVCQAQCNLEGMCELPVDSSVCYDFGNNPKQPTKTSCYADNPTIPAEQYERNNQTYYRCTGDYIRDGNDCIPEVTLQICDEEIYDRYNLDTQKCERTPSLAWYCSDGKKAEFDDQEKRYICENPISQIRFCDRGQLYDSVNNQCVDELEVVIDGENQTIDKTEVKNTLYYENSINTTAFYALIVLFIIFILMFIWYYKK
jgi:hypothetical protein